MKKYILWVLLIILVAVASLIVWLPRSDYFEIERNWVTYENPDLNIGFDYPDNCEVMEPALRKGFFYYEPSFEYVGSIYVSECLVDLDIFTNPDNLSVEDWAEEYRSNQSTGVGKSGEFEKVDFNGVEAYAVNWGCCMSYQAAYLIPHEGNMYLIKYGPNVMFDERELDDYTIDILDTLTF